MLMLDAIPDVLGRMCTELWDFAEVGKGGNAWVSLGLTRKESHEQSNAKLLSYAVQS